MPADRSLNPGNQEEHQDKTTSQPGDAARLTGLSGQAETFESAARDPRSETQAELPQHADYEITAELGRGGMGRVLAGRELALDREVAIKTLLPGVNANRFLTEARITARLPHPGIPPVHALGTLPDGSPFLAMKLVRGQTLAEALNARQSPAANLPHFLQVFEQVAQAVGFAHSQGIIHRDLKPANVMVGAFGEVHVMDWGLARDMRQSQTKQTANQQAATEAPPEDEASITRDGAVMGTPSYMAPEQARGEAVDERADVFSLGGILAAILTGQPPFQASSTAETVALAASGQTRDVLARLEACGADEGLLQLARRCLAVDPAARPVDASEVAELVSDYRDGVETRLQEAKAARAVSEAKSEELRKRQRVVRIAASIVVAVLLVGIAGTTLGLLNANAAWEAEADRAEGERLAKLDMKKEYDRAELALKDVRASIMRYVDVVQNEELLKDPRFKDVIPRLLDESLTQLESYVEVYGNAQDAEIRTEVAQAFFYIGWIQATKGDASAAKRAYSQSIALREDLSQEVAADANSQVKLADSYNNIAGVYSAAGEKNQALEAYRQALEIRTLLAQENPTVTDYQDALAACHNNLGVLYNELGQNTQALAAFREALEIHEHLARGHPTVTEFESNLAASHHNFGLWYSSSGQRDEALNSYRRSIEIGERLIRENPTVTKQKNSLALSYNNIGVVYRATAQTDEALAAHRRALELREQLAGERPNVTQYQANVAKSHNNVGIVYNDLNLPNEALAAYQRAVEINKRLVRENPTVADYAVSLGGNYVNLGAIQRDKLRAYDDALESADEAIAVLEVVYKQNSHYSSVREFTCNAFVGRALTYEALEDWQLAADDWSHVIEIDDEKSKNLYRNRLARAFALGGDHRRAIETTQAVIEQEDNALTPVDQFGAACIISVAINAVEKDMSLEESNRNALEGEYALRAISILHKVAERGLFDAPKFRKMLDEDPALSPLRDRDDYIELIESIDAKEQPELDARADAFVSMQAPGATAGDCMSPLVLLLK